MSESLSDAVREEYPGQAQDELDKRAFDAQQEPMSTDRARLLYALGRMACNCCARVDQEDLDEFDTWLAGRLPSRDEIAETLRESVSNRAHDDFRDYFDAQADAVLALIREHVTRG